MLCAVNLHSGIDLFDTLLYARKLFFRHQIDFVEQHTISKCQLQHEKQNKRNRHE
jgi:hypothetical protein